LNLTPIRVEAIFKNGGRNIPAVASDENVRAQKPMAMRELIAANTRNKIQNFSRADIAILRCYACTMFELDF